MSRLLIVGGILLIVVGIGATIAGTLSNFSQFTTDIISSTDNAAQYCNEGETLVEETGRSEYTPGQGYGSSVRYFCENGQGSRREVTGEFVQGMFGNLGSLFGGLGSGFSFMIVIGLGMLLLIVGIFMSFTRRMNTRPQLVPQYPPTPYYPPQTAMPVNAPPAAPYGQPTYGAPSPQPPAPGVPQDLNSQLRALQEARDAGFISITEYEKARQHLIEESRKSGD